MTEISVHDNMVTGYAVSCDRREIVIHTIYRDREPNEKTDIVFHGVEAFHLVGDNMQTILFDVDESPIEQILKDFASEFKAGVNYAWPGLWNKSPESCMKHCVERKCKGWIVTSSFGMGGFIIARSMELKQE